MPVVLVGLTLGSNFMDDIKTPASAPSDKTIQNNSSTYVDTILTACLPLIPDPEALFVAPRRRYSLSQALRRIVRKLFGIDPRGEAGQQRSRTNVNHA